MMNEGVPVGERGPEMKRTILEPVALLTAAAFFLQCCASVTRAPARPIAVTAAVTEAAAPTEEADEEASLPPARLGMNDRGAEAPRAYDPAEPLLTRITGLRPPVFGLNAQNIPSRWPTDQPSNIAKVVKAFVVMTVVFAICLLLFSHWLGKQIRNA